MIQPTPKHKEEAREKPQLLPCPFCGGVAECGMLGNGEGGIYVDRMGAYCLACDFEMSSTIRVDGDEEGWPWRDLHEVAAKWNKRAALSSRDTEIREVLEGLLEFCDQVIEAFDITPTVAHFRCLRRARKLYEQVQP